MKKTIAIMLLIAVCAFCACSIADNPFEEAHSRYYTDKYDGETMEGSVVVRNLDGEVIYKNEEVGGACVKHMPNGVVKVPLGCGTECVNVHYISIPEGKVGSFFSPVIAGNGIVCEVEQISRDVDSVKYNLVVYKMFSDSDENEILHREPFEGPAGSYSTSVVTNASFLGEDGLKVTHWVDVGGDWYEKTMIISYD